MVLLKIIGWSLDVYVAAESFGFSITETQRVLNARSWVTLMVLLGICASVSLLVLLMVFVCVCYCCCSKKTPKTQTDKLPSNLDIQPSSTTASTKKVTRSDIKCCWNFDASE